MNKKGFIIGITIIVLTFGFLVIRGLDKSMMTYVEVSQIKSEPQMAQKGVMQITGIVQPGTVQTSGGGKHLSFLLQDMKEPSLSIPVDYTGIIPDNFKPGLQVIVQGKLSQQDQTIQAEQILVKCPSKYEATVEETAS